MNTTIVHQNGSADRAHINGTSAIAHLFSPRVTWRTYGLHGEFRRPMIHRFDCNGADSIQQAYNYLLTQAVSNLATAYEMQGVHPKPDDAAQ